MSPSQMTLAHQSPAPWEWLLRPTEVARLTAERHPRWLTVTAGRAWLTQSGAGPHASDVWLEAGERHRLPAGTEWVVEGWPQARLAVYEAPPAPVSAAAPRWRAWPPALSAA